MDLSVGSSVSVPHCLASDGDRLCDVNHTVEHLDGEGGLALLSGSGAGAQLGPDQVLVSAHHRFCVVAPAVTGRTLPADAAAFGHELDVAVARALLVWIVRAQHGVSPGRDDYLGWLAELTNKHGLVHGTAVVRAYISILWGAIRKRR